MSFEATLDWARAEDAADPLAAFRAEFAFPQGADGRRVVYLCGNSLGLQPLRAAAEVERVLSEWRRLGVSGHHGGGAHWLSYHDRLRPALASLAGARPDEVVAMNSLTVNLHLLLASFYRPSAARPAVLMERGAFPSDRYAVVSQLRWHGLDEREALVELEPRPGESCLRTDDVVGAIERAAPRLALVLLPGVQFLTGQAFDLAACAAAARAAGAPLGLDLAHAIGNVPLALHDWGVDFAVWCSYKYLNAGPGATGGAFVHARHAEATLPRLAGWWGTDAATRFEFSPHFRPAAGAAGWQVSTGPVLGSAPLKASLAQFEAAGLAPLLLKSRRLTGYLEYLIDRHLAGRFELITPRAPHARGAQLSLRARQGPAAGRSAWNALLAHGVVCDWRPPDIIRLAPAPLYNSFVDCWSCVEALRQA